MDFAHAPGATPLDPDEAEGLIPLHITTRAQLDEWEHLNIIEGEEWAFAKKRSDVLTDHFFRELHRRMFGSTWKWAGTYRKTDKNIGIPWSRIPEGVRNLCADARAWIEYTSFSAEEAAVRLHLRSVQVHAFPNGNGRHARLLADVLLHTLGLPRLPWRGADLQRPSDTRDAYISALRRADLGEIAPLVLIARTP